MLREINDLSYRDIAEVVGAPVGTVMSRLARARAMLREAWLKAGRRGAMTMTCEEAGVLLHALIDGELDAGHAREVEAHLARLRALRGAIRRPARDAAQALAACAAALCGAGGAAPAHRRGACRGRARPRQTGAAC